MKFILKLVDKTPLVILFDTFVKFKSVTIPYHLIDAFVDYCEQRNVPVYGGLMEKEYQFMYTESI